MSFQVGDYRAVSLIGVGGTAQVWSGVRVATGAPVAMKVFTPDQLPAARREAALAAAVDHPHVVSVLDVLGTAERAVLVTELAAGGDLAELLIRRDRLTPGETLTVLVPIAAALATAHERQIVHGDLSAQNVVFDRAGRPLLADLGAARAAAEVGLPVAATPVDAAPELARGGPPTTATDMFSLGSIALACLTGRHAWPAEDLRDVLIQAAAGQWPDPGDDVGPPALIAVVRALLEHDPERRPGAASVALDLRAAGRPEPVELGLSGSGGPTVGNGAVLAGEEGHRSDSDPTEGHRTLGHRTESHRTDRHRAERHRAEPSPEVGGGTHNPERARSREQPPGSGRHLRTARSDEDDDEYLRPSGGMDRPAGQRLAGARAITRVRSDAPRAATSARVGLGSRRVRLGLVRPLSGHPTGGSTRSLVRLGVIAAACLVVAGLAGATGLWWARSDRSDPVTLQPASSAVTGTSNATASPGQRVQAPAMSPSVLPPVPAVSAMQRPAPSSSPPISPRAPSTTSRTSPPAGPRAVDPVGASADTPQGWLATVNALDGARSRALVARDPTLLDAVYTSDSTARSADAAVIAKLLAEGLRVSGAEHAVRTAKRLGGAPLRVAVNDSLPAYSVLDASGKVVGRTSSRPVATRVLILVRTEAGYRISQVQSA